MQKRVLMKLSGPSPQLQQYQTTTVRDGLTGPCATAVAAELGAEVLFSLAAARCTGIVSAFWVVAPLFVAAVDAVFMVVAGSVRQGTAGTNGG